MTILTLPVICSIAGGTAALVWARGVIPVIAATFAVGACWVLV